MANLKSRIIHHLIRRHGAQVYGDLMSHMDELADRAFRESVGDIGPNSSVHHPVYMHDAKCAKIGAYFYAGPGFRLEAWTSFQGETYTPRIEIGDRVGVNNNVHIGVINLVSIGDDVLIGSNVLITDHAHGHTDGPVSDKPFAARPLVSKGPVIIHPNVWIGEGACILAGVTIGSGAIIGANAVVTRNVEAGACIGGVPGKPIVRRPATANNE